MEKGYNLEVYVKPVTDSKKPEMTDELVGDALQSDVFSDSDTELVNHRHDDRVQQSNISDEVAIACIVSIVIGVGDLVADAVSA